MRKLHAKTKACVLYEHTRGGGVGGEAGSVLCFRASRRLQRAVLLPRLALLGRNLLLTRTTVGLGEKTRQS